MSDTPIGDHALLSDCRSVALVTSDGSVDWLCWPRIDSPAVFGRLLDPEAGHFRIAPAEADAIASWRYRGAGLVLETCWVGEDGEPGGRRRARPGRSRAGTRPRPGVPRCAAASNPVHGRCREG